MKTSAKNVYQHLLDVDPDGKAESFMLWFEKIFSLLENTRELGFLVKLVKAKKINDASPVIKLFTNAIFEAKTFYGVDRSKNYGNTCQNIPTPQKPSWWLLKFNG